MEVCSSPSCYPCLGCIRQQKFSDSTNEDLTEAANLINLVYDYYNNGSLGANIDVRLSRYNEECKYGEQLCHDWFLQVKYWYDNDCTPSDDEQEWYANYWMETMLNCIDFEYDESKNPDNKKKAIRKDLERMRKSKGFRDLGDMLYLD